METNTIYESSFNYVASERHLNLNQLFKNAFSAELKRFDNQFVKSEPPKKGRMTIKQLCSK